MARGAARRDKKIQNRTARVGVAIGAARTSTPSKVFARPAGVIADLAAARLKSLIALGPWQGRRLARSASDAVDGSSTGT
jgi:hypothetical protein